MKDHKSKPQDNYSPPKDDIIPPTNQEPPIGALPLHWIPVEDDQAPSLSPPDQDNPQPQSHLTTAPNTEAPLEKSGETLDQLAARLNPKHLRIAMMHLEGLSNVEIAQYLQMTKEGISVILRREDVKDYLDQSLQAVHAQFRSLLPETFGVIRGALRSDDEKTQLKAAGMVLQENRELEKKRGQNPDAGGKMTNMILIQQIIGGQGDGK